MARTPRTWHSGRTPRKHSSDHPLPEPNEPSAVRRELESVVSSGVLAATWSFLTSDNRFDPAAKASEALNLAALLMVGQPRMTRVLVLGARRLARRLGAEPLRARAARVAGQAACATHRYLPAARLLRRAEALHASLGDELAVAAARVMRAQNLVGLGRYAEARELSEGAREVLVRSGERGRLARLEVALGNLAYRLDHLREALSHLRRAYGLLPDSERPMSFGVVSLNIANALAGLRRARAARRYFDRARKIFAEHGPANYLAEVDFNEGYAELLRGRFAAARRLLDEAAEAFSAIGSAKSVAAVNIDRADLYLQLGMPGQAREYAGRALTELAGEELTKEQASAAFFEAVAALLDGLPREAELGFAQARELFVNEDNDAWRAQCELMCAVAATEQGALGRARTIAERALADLHGLGDSARAASAELLLVRIGLAQDRPDEVLERVERAASYLSGLETPWLHVELERYRGLAHLASGVTSSAIEHLQGAVRALERQRGHVPADEFMVAFMASKASLYAELVDALVEAGRNADAFEYTERARSRALVDMMAGRAERAQAVRPRKPVPGLLATRIEHLRGNLSDVYARIHREGADPERLDRERVAALRRRSTELEARLAPLMREARAHDPEFASLTVGGALDVAEVQELLADDTTLLSYFVGPRACHVFVVNDAEIERITLDVDAGQLEARVNAFRFHMSKFLVPDGFAARQAGLALRAARANLARLAEALLSPVLDRLQTRQLVVVPHGELHALPFHALPLDAGWLSEHFDVAYAPSATVQGYCARRGARASGPASVLAVPDALAPEIEGEARAVAEALGTDTRLAIGAEATWERFVEDAGRSRILHVASHGTFRRDEPTLSSLKLHDRWANLYDLYGLDLRCDLVTLSGCETGVTRVSRAEGLLGLVRGLLYAGAPRVLVSRWRVDDVTTALLMRSFYGAVRGGATYAGALSQAMAAVRETAPNPYHWASFFLMGMPGRDVPDRA